jgi:hypothetical protein
MNARRRTLVLGAVLLVGILSSPLVGCNSPHRRSNDYGYSRDREEQRELAAHQREEQRNLDREQAARDRSYDERHSWWPFWR